METAEQVHHPYHTADWLLGAGIKSLKQGLTKLDSLDLFDYVTPKLTSIPEFELLRNCKQHPRWHAEGDVLTHINMTMAEILKLLPVAGLEKTRAYSLYLGALLHDFGKPFTTKTIIKEGVEKLVAYGHEEVGVSYAREFLRKYFEELSIMEREFILSFVEFHGYPRNLVRENADPQRYLKLSMDSDTELLYWLEVADFKGRLGDSAHEALEQLETFKHKCIGYETWGVSIPPITRKVVTPIMPTLTITIGAPGSGKSTYIKALDNPTVVCMDDERVRLCGTAMDMSKNDQVYRNCFSSLKQELLDGHSVVWDATSPSRKSRKSLIDLAESLGVEVRMVWFDTPLGVCIERNANRERVVPAEVIERIHRSLQFPKSYEYGELVVVREGGQSDSCYTGGIL